ncbi:MAG: ABC transporter ATP-binding protein [Thermoplasmatota archaeon]
MVGISVNGLTIGYSKKPVLEDISFEVNEGDFIGVIGPNASGKSTLVRALTRVIKPWKGDIKIDGRSLLDLSRKDIAKKMAVVPQDTYISFPFTAREVVLMGRNPYLGRFENPSIKDKGMIDEMMKETNTIHLGKRSVRNLSGGEMQRVVLARALAQDTDVLLLDEATSHLDIGNKLDIMDMIKRKNEEKGISVLSIHHNLNLAARYCERLILLDEGEIQSRGAPEDVLTPSHLKAVYGIEAEIYESPKDGQLYISPIEKKEIKADKDLKIHVVCGGGTGGDLLKRLVEEGYMVSTGVLNVMDTDLERARFLDIHAVTEAPFSSISERSYEKNIEKIDESDIVICTDFPIGYGNLKNLKAVLKAVKKGKNVVVIEDTSIKNKDYTEGEGTEIYIEIKSYEDVTVISNKKEVIDFLGQGKT